MFKHVRCVPRERFKNWPRLPTLRDDTAWEDLTFVWGLRKVYRPSEFDVTMTCSFPWTNLWLRRGRREGVPRHIFVTQNGDWPCHRTNSEYRWFDCDALVCTNPDYYEAHKGRYNATLIPNGVDPSIFSPGPAERQRFGLPDDRPVVLMVSELIPSKRVSEGIKAVAQMENTFLVVAGNGPLRDEIDQLGAELLPGRFKLLQAARDDMPGLYRSVDAFLHMSVDEPSANAYIEALATGLGGDAVMASVTRWTFEDTAHLVDTRNLPLVAAALARAIRDSGDQRRQLRRELCLRRFTWEGIGAATSSLFQNSWNIKPYVDLLNSRGKASAH